MERTSSFAQHTLDAGECKIASATMQIFVGSTRTRPHIRSAIDLIYSGHGTHALIPPRNTRSNPATEHTVYSRHGTHRSNPATENTEHTGGCPELGARRRSLSTSVFRVFRGWI